MNEFFRGFIKIHILHHAEAGPIFGGAMAKELERHGYGHISPGTLYPTLHALEKDGLLQSERRLEGGRWRRYYTITPAGRVLLDQIRQRLRELADEVLLRAAHHPYRLE